jgi:hypothetical protein
VSNNNEEAVTYSLREPGATGSTYWNTLNLSDTLSVEEQIEVIRKFDLTLIDDLVNDPPTAAELETLYTLPRSLGNGSPMYTLDLDTGQVVMSSVASDYTWEDGNHHDRGANLLLPVYDSTTDTLIVNRRTPSALPVVVWIDGAKVTARSLNAANDQVIHLIQELRSRALNPTDLSFDRGASLGTCPLDSNGVIPLKHIPSELGGQGELFIDLSDHDLEELQDVADVAPINGNVLFWNSSLSPAGQWSNGIPLQGVLDLAGADPLDILRWDGSDWELAPLILKDLGNVTTDTPVAGNILNYNDSTGKWELAGNVNTADSSYPARSDNQLLTWNSANSAWEAKEPPSFTYEVFDPANTSIFSFLDVGFFTGTDASNIAEGDVLAWSFGQQLWKARSLDTWDLNNGWYGTEDESVGPDSPLYSGGRRGVALHHWYEDGWVLYWDNAISQKDQPPGGPIKGAFHVGPVFHGGTNPTTGEKYVNLHTAKNLDVLKWRITADGRHWENDAINLNHLKDVDAFGPNDGDVIRWSEDADEWILVEGPDDLDQGGGSYGQFKTSHEFVLGQANSSGTSLPRLWSTAYESPHSKIRIYDWQLLTTTSCKCQLHLYKTTKAGWRTGVFTRMDATQVVGWLGVSRTQKKISNANLNMAVTDLEADEIFVMVVDTLDGDTTDPPHINFIVTWEILES